MVESNKNREPSKIICHIPLPQGGGKSKSSWIPLISWMARELCSVKGDSLDCHFSNVPLPCVWSDANNSRAFKSEVAVNTQLFGHG